MNWRDLSAKDLKREIGRLELALEDIETELNAANAERADRELGIRVGEEVTIQGEVYVRVTAKWDSWPHLQKKGMKRVRAAYRWREFRAGKTEVPW